MTLSPLEIALRPQLIASELQSLDKIIANFREANSYMDTTNDEILIYIFAYGLSSIIANGKDKVKRRGYAIA